MMNIYLLVIMVLVHGYNCETTPTSMPSLKPSSMPSTNPTSIPSFRPSLRPSSMPSPIPTSMSLVKPLAKSSAMPLPNYNIVIFGIGSSLFVFSMCAYKLSTFLGSSPKITPLSQEKYLDIDFQESNNVL